MLQAQLLRALGYKQYQIVEMLGVSERTERIYLKNPPSPRRKSRQGSKLDPWKLFIGSIIDKEPHHNCLLLLKRIKNQGYTGKISIPRDYAAEVRKKVLTEAMSRFRLIALRSKTAPIPLPTAQNRGRN